MRKDADEPSPEVTVEEVWCMAVRDTVEDGYCDCIEKHDVSSEHRNESKLKEFPEQRDREVIKNIETDQHSRKVIKSIETGQNSRKVITKIEKDEQDRNRTWKSGHGGFMKNELMGQKLPQEILKEFVMNSLMDQKLKQDDDVTDENVDQSRTAESDSERDAYQVRVQEKVETIWLFDTGAGAHVMPKHVWEQLAEPSLQTTRVTLRGANGQVLGAMGEVQDRGFTWKNHGSVSSQQWLHETRDDAFNTGVFSHIRTAAKR